MLRIHAQTGIRTPFYAPDAYPTGHAVCDGVVCHIGVMHGVLLDRDGALLAFPLRFDVLALPMGWVVQRGLKRSRSQKHWPWPRVTAGKHTSNPAPRTLKLMPSTTICPTLRSTRCTRPTLPLSLPDRTCAGSLWGRDKFIHSAHEYSRYLQACPFPQKDQNLPSPLTPRTTQTCTRSPVLTCMGTRTGLPFLLSS